MATLDRNNPYQEKLFEKKVLHPYWTEYYNNTLFSRFIGSQRDAVIHLINQKKGEGDTIIFPVQQVFAPNVKRGAEQLTGNESNLTFSSDVVSIDLIRFGIAISGEDLLKLQIKQELNESVKYELLRQASNYNTQRIVRSFGLSFAPSIINNRNFINYDWAYSDIVTKISACGIDTLNASGDAMSSNRVVFGKDFRTNETLVGDVLAKAGFTAANGHVMSLDHIRRLAMLARMGSKAGTLNKENPIAPYRVAGTQLGVADNRYVLFLGEQAFLYMATYDADWKSQVNRGVIETASQPSIQYGTTYKGSVEGVDIVIVKELDDYISSGTAYSVLCGAGAIAFAQGLMPQIKYQDSDYEYRRAVAHVEISAFKPLKYPSKSDLNQKGSNSLLIDNGMIHSFTKIS